MFYCEKYDEYRKCEGMKLREDRFIIKVVEMYYKQGMSQVEIGKKLEVSRTTVARALTKARKQGYVEIKINYPEGAVISKEEQLEKKYNLREAAVACQKPNEDITEEVAYYASDFILRILHDHMTLGMARGETIAKTIACLKEDVRLKFLKPEDIRVVTLMATTNIPAGADLQYKRAYSNYLCEETANILNGTIYHILAPQYVDNGETKQLFLREKNVKTVLNIAANADAALIGIGTVDEHSAMVRGRLLPEKQFEELKQKGGVGELLSHIIDKEGNLIEDGFEERLISLDLESLKKIPVRIGVASGIRKAEAVRAALNKQYINVLITDEYIADYLLGAK